LKVAGEFSDSGRLALVAGDLVYAHREIFCKRFASCRGGQFGWRGIWLQPTDKKEINILVIFSTI
jgi:hypothetical protein